ncbi:PucR family transcriptional regulator [Agromyces sp. SYSU K20354]|uniref:PucR family transcriptional regulator n=1 Tax=Agromyces cavernae TaxID=2898659 RepID=UPI001E284EAF|nr:PucR family transcriptional regulator [Agromyces cavernae]MCD2443285.1 PucR family transcriptional regulator [Agromyces cavernae]
MPDRREDAAIRTDRPSAPSAPSVPSADGGLPTVREILTLPPVAAGVPEVLSSESALDARVRWVHVSDSAGVARLLNGGELLLSTGSGWPTEPDELADFIVGLVEAGLSGLVLELGVHYRYVPAIVESAARERGLALVALHHEVKFVTLTEAVHSRIISEQTAALRARDEVRERFTALSLRGAPADYVVRQLADTLGAAVVLENLAHEVVAAEGAFGADGEVLADWESRSRRAHRRATEPPAAEPPATTTPGQGFSRRSDDWLIVPVEARGTRWGYLIALPGPTHPAGRTAVLEQGAIALALGRLAEGDADADEWVRASRQRLIDGLLAGRFAGLAAASARLVAAGLPLDGAVLHGLVATGAPVTGKAADVAARTLGGRAIAGDAPGSTSSGHATVVLLSLPASSSFGDRHASAFAHEIAGGGASADRLVLSIGAAAADLDGLLGSVQEALDLARAPGGRVAHGPTLRRGEDRPLMRLVTSLRDDHRLLRHSERMLAPLIEYDLARGGDLLHVLGAMLAHPANRTAAASASHLSRSVFYQRLALIGDLLGVDLDDGETLTALHLALLVRRSASR